jgi:hypothetical protein
MLAYKTEITLAADGKVTLTELPFVAGDRIEVIVLGYPRPTPDPGRYPLRRKPIRYEYPTEPVAQEDWEMFSRKL